MAASVDMVAWGISAWEIPSQPRNHVENPPDDAIAQQDVQAEVIDTRQL
jgi:hypothetical protein